MKSSKLVESEWRTVQNRIKNSGHRYQVFNIPIFDGKKELLMQLLDKIQKEGVTVAVILTSAGVEMGSFLSWVPVSEDFSLIAEEWVRESVSTDSEAFLIQTNSSEFGPIVSGHFLPTGELFPEKVIDRLVNESINYLRHHQLVKDDDDDDDDDEYIDPNNYGLGDW